MKLPLACSSRLPSWTSSGIIMSVGCVVGWSVWVGSAGENDNSGCCCGEGSMDVGSNGNILVGGRTISGLEVSVAAGAINSDGC